MTSSLHRERARCGRRRQKTMQGTCQIDGAKTALESRLLTMRYRTEPERRPLSVCGELLTKGTTDVNMHIICASCVALHTMKLTHPLNDQQIALNHPALHRPEAENAGKLTFAGDFAIDSRDAALLIY